MWRVASEMGTPRERAAGGATGRTTRPLGRARVLLGTRAAPEEIVPGVDLPEEIVPGVELAARGVAASAVARDDTLGAPALPTRSRPRDRPLPTRARPRDRPLTTRAQPRDRPLPTRSRPRDRPPPLGAFCPDVF